MAQESRCCTWDITVPIEHITVEEMCKKLKESCKKWCFQVELSETGYKHIQGRISFKQKCRLKQAIEILGTPQIHLSKTSSANVSNNFYVMKEDTRVDGPYQNTEEDDIYVPRQIREITELYPWQKTLIEISKEWDKRSIHIIIDEKGNIGKTILTQYMMCYKLGRKVPYCNNYKDLMRMVCDIPTSKCYIIDLPRAIDKEKLHGMFAAIEEIKSGYAWDDRYKFKEKLFDCPQIFVFTNEVPERQMLSMDRWVFHTIADSELVLMHP